MSGSGFRGRGIEPWSVPNGFTGPFRGGYSSNPRFYHPRLSYSRLPTPENWSGRSNYNGPFLSWKNAKFQSSACRNKFNFRSNGRGRGTFHRGALHFPNSNTPSIKSHSVECNQNIDKPETMFIRDQHGQDKFEQSNNSCKKQTILLGSEEEHQQKITETAVRLQEKLSNITKEDISNLWQDDLSTISSNVEGKSIFNVSIPNLSYKEPDLNLTFNDFKDIGRIDSDHSMSDKYNGTNIAENASNFVQDTFKKKRNKAIIEVINLIEIEDVHDVESMTDVNNTTNNKPHNNNGQKLKKKTTFSHSIRSSTDSEICDTGLVNSVKSSTTKTDFLKDQTVSLPENTQVQDHHLNTKYVSKPSHQSKNEKSDDNCTLEDTQKSCDDTQQEQVNSIIEMQRVTKKKTRWTPLPYETSSLQRKPFESRWLNRRHDYTSNKSTNELAGFDLHAPSSQHHRDSISLYQNSQDNTSLNLSGCGTSEKSSTIPELMHNQDNSQSMLHVEHNTSYSIFTNIPSSQEHILQTSAFDAQKSSHSATGYNICKEKIINIPNFDPLQPPPNFNNQKGAVPLSPTLDSHILSQEISNFKMYALDSSQLSAVSTSPTDLYCPATFSTTQGTIILSTLSQSSTTSSPNLLSIVPNNASPILAYATSLQMTPCEISSATITNNTDQVSSQHNIVKVNNELEEIQEAMQFAKQSMNVADINHIDESNQTLHSETHLLDMSLEQESVSVTPSAKLQKTPNKTKEKLNKYTNKPNNKKGQVVSESRVSSELEHEKQLSQNCNVEENTVLINEQNPTKMMLNSNPILNKINKQEKLYQRTESGERERCIPYKSQSNMNLKECSSEKKITESPSLESSWKTRIINRFLKMSKNDIRNMINNCSLRKFDIAMKHLIKEKKSSLSLEMRNIQDEKIKGYDGEEFMNQLNAMLDPTAIVDISNLPTEFIRHLSEVLQLDAIELTENVCSQFNNGSQCNNADALTALHVNEKEMLNNTVIGENVNDIKTNNKANGENNNESIDYCNIIMPPIIIESSNNDNNEVMFVTPDKTQKSKVLDSSPVSSKIRSETNDLHMDHIRNDTNTVTKNINQKHFEKGKQHSIFNMADLDEIAKTSIPIETTSTVSIISKNKTSSLIKHHGYNSEDEYISKSKRYNRWIRREREGPDAFRNLTKEEWEAKYGRQTKSSSNPCRMQINRYYNSRHANTRYNKPFNSRRHSPLSLKRNRNYKIDISRRMIKKDKNTKTVSSTSNTSESDDTSTSSDNRTPSEVTKLLKVIKEKEKIAKNKSLNETIRDEVTAEIQRKWNEEGKKGKYYTKDKRTKEKKSKYKKERKKRRRKLSDSSSSDYGKDGRSSLLAETEIKKETINKEESDTILEKNITCDIKTVNNGCSDKQIPTKLLTDKRISSEIKEKCTIQENDKCKPALTIVQPKTKAQLKLIPSTSKHIEETEFMKNTAKIVLNAKCRENNPTTLNSIDKPKMIEKIHQEDANASGINVASECSENRLVDIIETAHIVSNNNENTKKNLINASISKEEHDKDNSGNLTKDISSVSVEVQESTTKGSLVNKEISKKIDIKAYKARALQKKLENEDKIKEKQATVSNNTSKSIIEEKDKSNTVLAEKLATIEITKLSVDSNKFKNIRSEGKKELKLKNKTVKKKAEIKTEMKNIKGMLSDNQERINNTSDVSKLVESEVENDLLDVHTNKDEELIQTYTIQNKEICFNNAISPKNILKETEDGKDERILTDVNTIGSANVVIDKLKCMEELQITNLTEALNDTRTENNIDKNLSECVKDPTNLELNLTNVQDVSKTNMVECGCISIHSTNSANANLLVSSNEQNIHVKEDIVIRNEINQKLFENLENLEILKVYSPGSVGSPFKGFEANDEQHVETNNIITANEDNVKIDEKKELQACNNDECNWQNISSQNISADNNNISFKNIFNDSLNRVGETCTDKEPIFCEKSSDINEGAIFNLNNNTKLLDSDYDKGKKEKSTGQIFVQNGEISIPYTSSQQREMPMLNEYEDNAVMEKSDIDILKDSSCKDQSFIKNIGSICASIDGNSLNIHNTIPSSFSEISNETSKTTIDTDTELSLNSLVEDNATDHNSAFKDIPNQSIVNVTNQNSHKEESINNNDSFSNNSIKSFVSAEEPYKTFSQETLKKLQIPTKAALKESRNIFAIMDGSFSSIKGTIELKDPHSKLNIFSDQAAADFLSYQISQKENINNKVIDLEQKSCHSIHTSIPDDKDLDRSIDVESLSKTTLNNVKIISDEILISSNHSNCSKEIESNNTPNPAVNLNEIKEINKGIANTIQNTIEKNKTDEYLKKLPCTKTQKQEKTNNLHKIKTNQVMKHQMKNACKSNSVHITNKNIKEEIMARMIEIDVEIHKLMTEKMTLYQMLENDSLLLNKVPLNSNLGSEINREKIVPVGLETLSSSVSRIIQNTEISGDHSDCLVTSSRENALSEISQNQAESKVRDIYESKNESLLQEEDINTKQLLLTDSLENRTISEDNDSLQSLLLFKDENNIQKNGTVSPEDHLEENQDTYSTIEETLNNLTENSSLESITDLEKEEQLGISSPLELTKPSNKNQDAKHTLDENEKQNVQSVKTSKNNNSINASLIYSDDSTWSSFAQSFEEIERKKHNTGLALLEETYKREIAENKKLKASARKKKKKELNTFLKSVNYLTPEEEEIPLNTLYIKKLQQKRDLLDSLDDKKENSVMDSYTDAVESEEVWKHAIEVINAVAEDRVKDLYEEKVKESRSEIFAMPSNTLKQSEDICTSEMLTNLNESLQNSNEAQNTTSLLSYDPERNSIKCSLAIIDKNIIFQSKEKEENNENKKNNVQSTLSSSDNLEVNPAVTNMSSDNTLTQKEISLIEPLVNTDYSTNMSAVNEANELNISNTKLNKNQKTHVSLSNSSNENTAMNILTSENCKYNNKTEETNIQGICLLKNKEIDIPTIGFEKDVAISSTVEKIANTANNSLKKCKDEIPIPINPSEEAEISVIYQSSNIHNKKILKRKDNNKNIPIRKRSKHAEDNIKYMECNNTNSGGEKDPSKVCHDSKSIVVTHQDLVSTSSNVKHNRNSQKLQTIKNKKYVDCFENKESIKDELSVVNENLINHCLPNVDLQVSKPNVHDIGVKRKIHDQSELMNCKVVLIDVLKSNMYKHIIKKCHASFTTSHTPHKSNTLETTTNSAHRITSSKIKSSIVEANKLKDIPKSKHSCISGNVQEQTSNVNQKHVTFVALENAKELKSHHKVKHNDILYSDEYLSLKSNYKDISIVPIKPATSNVKILPQDKNTELEIIEDITKEQCIVHQPNDEKIPSPDAITENEQPLKTHYTVHKGPILDIKVFRDTFLAASEDGSIYRYSQVSNEILNIYKGHRSAVTCLYIHKSNSIDHPKDLIYSGSLDGTLRCYNIKTGASINNIANIGSPIQCMDQAWGIIFIGTKSGHVSRFHIKFGVVKGDNIQFSNKSVLALKATNEGPRKVLIVASRNQPITIRDAQNGLFLRTICGQRNHTVYSLMLNNNLIYCGTSSTSILVFDFTNGEQKMQYNAGVGIVCMRLYHKLLFAGCYDGNIYVFDIQNHRLICSIPGPGNMLLSMEVVDNKIIAGSKDKRLHTWQMPKQVQVVSREKT